MTACRQPSPDPTGDAAATGRSGRAGAVQGNPGAARFQEAITYSFVDPAFQGARSRTEPLALANPISADLAVMRTSLWPGLLKALIHNQKRQQVRVRLFEHGLNFIPADDGLRQEPYLGGVVAGAALPNSGAYRPGRWISSISRPMSKRCWL
jgi:phenylalanyl-tRNA synthetase beta subunit